MEIKEFLNSAEFRLIMDETMQKTACETVDALVSAIERKNWVDPAQIHSIQDIVRAGGVRGLRRLAESQKDKTTKEKNKAFWTFVHSLINESTEAKYGKSTLYTCIEQELQKRKFLRDPESASDKPEQRKIRRQNRTLIDEAIDKALSTYFEHFNCHYLYKTGQHEESANEQQQALQE